MRDIYKDRMKWVDGTIAELALRAREDTHDSSNRLASRLQDAILLSKKVGLAELNVHNFATSVNLNMRIIQREKRSPNAFERITAHKLIDILCGDTLPNELQIKGISRTLDLDVTQTESLLALLHREEHARQMPSAEPVPSFAETLQEQSRISGLGLAQREHFRRMANAVDGRELILG